MNKSNCIAVAAVVVAISCVSLQAADSDWRQFRGTNQTSAAQQGNPPTKWDLKSGENVAWTAELPGRGPSCPIVVADNIIVTASSGPAQDKLHVLCFAASTGKQRWHRQFWATGRCFSHPQSANAAPTPASDGKQIYAFFSSNDLICLDLEGNLQWFRGLAQDYPKAGNDVGMSASPLVVGDTVVVQVENQGDSFAAGIDTVTGESRWRIARAPEANWCSPAVLSGAGDKALVLLQSPHELTAHNPQTGERVWKYAADCQAIPSVAVEDDRIYLPAGGITALEASPDSTVAKFLWAANKLGPGAASPIVHNDRLYTLSRAPVLACSSTKDGEILWQLRLKGAFWATPAIVGDHMYCLNFDGACQVIKLGDSKGEVVATNEFGDALQASPAISGDSLYVRSDKHLWKISEKK